MKILYLCLHILQAVPASCINRDDTGTPKSMYYGNVRRSRISSQALKRAARMYMQKKYGDTGVRTKQIVALFTERLVDEAAKLAATSEKMAISKKDAKEVVKTVLAKAKITADTDKKNMIAFYSKRQLEALFAILLEAYKSVKEQNPDIAGLTEAEEQKKEEEKKNTKSKKSADEKEDKDQEPAKKDSPLAEAVKEAAVDKLKEAVVMNPSESQLLFGRMFATDPNFNYDAAAQVAHAFSVNLVADESDYFTAVGDLKIEESSQGSEHLDTKLYNSGVLYRFADVNLSDGTELRKPRHNVDAADAAVHFLEAFVKSMPTGSINSYANVTLPDKVIVELREDQPVNYCPAFLNVVEGDRILDDAYDRMLKYQEWVTDNYGGSACKWVLGDMPFNDICDQVKKEINDRISS